MIAAWMLYAAVAAALLSLAAVVAEHALRVAGRASRWPWAAAMAGSVLLPAGAWLAARRGAASAAETAPDAAAILREGGGLSLDELLSRAVVVESPSFAALDAPLLALWCAASLGVMAWLGVGMLRLARARREWRPAMVAGGNVLVSGRTGPAVAGVLRPAIVLPEWALDAGDDTLALMLEHEREHVRAADPALLAAAAAGVALAPWNPALWWQLRRLRHAVEVDCDRRVLARHPDRRRYGALLLEVGRHAARMDDVALPIAAFASTRSSLERRIRTMTMRRPRHPLLQGAALAGGAALLVLAACETPRPTEVAPAGEIPLTSIRSAGAYAAEGSVTVERVREVLAQVMPAEAREARTGVPHEIWIVADADGKAVRTEIMRRPKGALPPRERAEVDRHARRMTTGIAPAAVSAVEVLKLGAGEVTVDPANVVWVQLKPGAALDASYDGSWIVTPGSVEMRRVPHDTTDTFRYLPRRDTVAGGLSDVIALGTVRARVLSPSASEGAEPLFILDGVIVTDRSALDGIDPERIESVEVLKGDAARKLYGERGVNGIIRVTTKQP